jgi:hypothetical protein
LASALRILAEMLQDEIPALLPRIPGHQFVLDGDACSGVTGALHEKTFASVNAVIQRLQPQPESDPLGTKSLVR